MLIRAGLCTKTDGGFSCSSTHTAKKGNLTTLHADSLFKDVMDLQNSISYLIPVVALIFFMFGLITLFLWVLFTKRQQKFTIFERTTKVERKVKMLHTCTKALLWFSTALALAAAFSTTTSLLALRITSRIFSQENTQRKVHCGTAIQILQWAIFTISAIFSAYIQFWFQASESKDAAAANPFAKTQKDQDAMSESAPLAYPSPTFYSSKASNMVFSPPPHY